MIKGVIKDFEYSSFDSETYGHVIRRKVYRDCRGVFRHSHPVNAYS